MSADERPTVVLAALAANLGIAGAKFAAFLVRRSSSLLAESVHSVADSGNEALLLLGVVATILAVEMRSLLIGEAASERDQAIVRAAVTQETGT